MTLEQLRMMIAVTETGSLKPASERLHKTQPAVSQGIAKLESVLNLQLFTRDQYRLAPTSAGNRLYQQAKKILSETYQFEQIAHHYSVGFETEVTLAFEGSFNLDILLPILEQAQQTYPETQIILKQHYVSGAFQAIQDDVADMAFTPIFDRIRTSSKFEFEPLYQGGLITVASEKLRERLNSELSLSKLTDEYQIIVQDTGRETKGIDLGVQEGQRRWYVNDFSTKKKLIMSGMGWGSLPDFMIEQERAQGLLIDIIAKGIPTEQDQLAYHVVKKSDNVLGPVARFIWQALLATSAN